MLFVVVSYGKKQCKIGKLNEITVIIISEKMQKKVNYATTAGAMHSIISKKYKFLYFSFEVILRKWLVKETFAAIKKRVKISPLTLICRKMKLIGNMQSIFLKR